MEMADPLKALAVCSYATTDAHCQRLLVGLQSIVEETITSPVTAKDKNTFHAEEAAGAPSSILDWTAFVSEPIPFAKHGIDVRYQEMASNSRKNKGKSHIVLFADSVGAICAEMVIPYPPGIPVLIPGERITGVAVQRLTQLSAAGTLFHGTHSPNLTHIKIYE
jgi:arginine/lysine/ornithine decarboxylase